MTPRDGKDATAGDGAPPPAAPRSATPQSGGRREGGVRGGPVGSALRSAYQKTIDEDVPPEFLDLLGKLS